MTGLIAPDALASLAIDAQSDALAFALRVKPVC
jgi:hypothetical protein